MKKPSRIIIKVGSSIIVGEPQRTLPTDLHVIERLYKTVNQLKQEGHSVTLVISGAVASGRRDATLLSRQAQAAYGQWALNARFSTAQPNNIKAGLILLSREDIVNRQRFLTLQETFDDLLKNDIVPVVNENDATTIKDKNDFPDNDHLSAIVSATIMADRLFLLTDVEGVYNGNPKNPNSKLIETIDNVNLELLKMVSGEKSALGRGGMTGKLSAARLATAAGVTTHILHGRAPERVVEVMHGNHHGTTLTARTHANVHFTNRDRWIIASLSENGSIQLDAGAAAAVKKGKSLLAVGMKNVYGTFKANDVVELIDHNQETVAVGRVKDGSDALSEMLPGQKKPFNTEIIHADDCIHI